MSCTQCGATMCPVSPLPLRVLGDPVQWQCSDSPVWRRCGVTVWSDGVETMWRRCGDDVDAMEWARSAQDAAAAARDALDEARVVLDVARENVTAAGASAEEARERLRAAEKEEGGSERLRRWRV